MDRVNRVFLVQELDEDFSTLKDRVFTDYTKAIAYFKQLLGEFLLDAFHDSEEKDGARDLSVFFKTYDKLYFEIGGGETVTSVPEEFEKFKEDCNGIIRFGDFDSFVIVLKMIEEVM